MNDGVLSMIILLITIILLLCGWREDLARGFTRRGLLIFFTTWCVGMFVVIPVGPTVVMQGVYLALGLILLRLLFSAQLGTVIYITVAGLMSGVIGYFIQQLYMADPVLLVIDPAFDIAIIIGFLAWAVSRQTFPQLAVLTVAWLTIEAAGLRTATWQSPIHLGSLGFQDRWWLTVGVARAITVGGALIVWTVQAIIRRFAASYRAIESKWRSGFIAKREDD